LVREAQLFMACLPGMKIMEFILKMQKMGEKYFTPHPWFLPPHLLPSPKGEGRLLVPNILLLLQQAYKKT